MIILIIHFSLLTLMAGVIIIINPEIIFGGLFAIAFGGFLVYAYI